VKKITTITIRAEKISATLTNAFSNRFQITPSVPAHFDGWAFSIDNLLYKTFTNSDSQTVQFPSDATGQQTVYLRGLKIVDGEEILDDVVVQKTATISASLSGNALYFNGGYAYTKTTSNHQFVSGYACGGISGYVNTFMTPAGMLSLWFKPMKNQFMYLLSRKEGNMYSGGNWKLGMHPDNGIHFYNSSYSPISSTNQYFGGDITVGEWHHVVVTCRAYYVMRPQHGKSAHDIYSQLKFYLNGSLLGTRTTGAVRDDPHVSMVIGGNDTSWSTSLSVHQDNRFYGYMDNLTYSGVSYQSRTRQSSFRVPTASEVAEMYNNGAGKHISDTSYGQSSRGSKWAHWNLGEDLDAYGQLTGAANGTGLSAATNATIIARPIVLSGNVEVQ
jgi:hypothetical protein